MEEIDIYLVDLKTADMTRFPMLPEKINVEAATRFASYDIMNIGEIKTPLGENLTVFSWDGIFPGEKRAEEPYIRMWSDPRGIQEKLSHYRASGSRLQLIITGTPIDHMVYLESYSVEYSGGFGDYTYSVRFVHLKDLKITTEAPADNANGGKADGKENRASKPEGDSYTVKPGDSLWKIAQSSLGDGSRYGEIAQLNGISNPNKINAGQKLQLPNK